jgi:hypothetical protein
MIKLNGFPCVCCISKTVEDTLCDHFGTEKKQQHLPNDGSKKIFYPIKKFVNKYSQACGNDHLRTTASLSPNFPKLKAIL